MSATHNKAKPISLRARIVKRLSGRYFDRIDALTVDPVDVRIGLDRLTRHLPLSRGVQSEMMMLGGRPTMRLTPRQTLTDAVMLYLHGGAYLMGSPLSHRSFVSKLAKAAGIEAVIPDYRLAPEHRFPNAVEDAVAAYRDLLGNGYRPERIVVAGDSAGGGLTMALLLALRDRDLPMPAGVFLFSPWTDLAATGESMESNRDRDPWFSKEDIAHAALFYCDPDKLTDPLASPVYGDMHGLAPVYIQVGDLEVLLSDSTRLADNIRAAGGEVELEVWPEMWHVFQVFYRFMPESRPAIRNIVAQMRHVLSKT